MRRVVLWTSMAGLVAACGTDPSAVLMVNMDDLPDLTQEAALTVTGTVTRSPEKEDPVLVIAVAGGRTTVRDTLAPTGEFTIEIQLNQNQENQLAITASDASGAISDPVIVVVHHDNVGPPIRDITPFNRGTGASLTTPIEVVFEEPLTSNSPSDGISLFHNASTVAGTSTLSSDQLKLTFVPDAPLRPNSVYEVRIVGFEDEAGNAAGSGQEICFITTFDGFATDSASDPPEDTQWQAGTPPSGLSRADFRRARFTRDGNTLFTVVQFGGPRTFGLTGDVNATLLIDVDVDQNPETGFLPVYDFLFSELDPNSGMGAELIIGVEPLASLQDSAYVGELVSNETEFQIQDAFLPGACGAYYGFDTDYVFETLGDDGAFDFTVLTFAQAEDGAYLDAGPETGHFSVDLSGGAPIAPRFIAPRSDTEPQTHRSRGWPRLERRR